MRRIDREFALLSSDVVAELQALGESNLPHVALSVTIATSSGARVGGALVDDATSTTTIVENEPCRLTPRALPAMASDASQARSAQLWLLVFRRGTVIPVNAIAHITGQDRDDAPWERRVRIIDTLRVRLVTSVASYSAIDVGPTGARVG